MDRNLGATQVATSSTDAAAYGDLYQWGRFTDGHQCRDSGTTSTLATSATPGHGDFITGEGITIDWLNTPDDNLWQGVSGVNNPCPTGYRLPTQAEWEAERTTDFTSNNSSGAFGSSLKLTKAGFRLRTGGVTSVNGLGAYWEMGASTGRYLFFTDSEAFMHNSNRNAGFSVRCIKED